MNEHQLRTELILRAVSGSALDPNGDATGIARRAIKIADAVVGALVQEAESAERAEAKSTGSRQPTNGPQYCDKCLSFSMGPCRKQHAGEAT